MELAESIYFFVQLLKNQQLPFPADHVERDFSGAAYLFSPSRHTYS
jgi:hypothetical protein